MAEVRDPVATFDSMCDSGNFLSGTIVRMSYDDIVPNTVAIVWLWEIDAMRRVVDHDDLDAIERLGLRFTRMRLLLETGEALPFREGDPGARGAAAGQLVRAAPELTLDDIGRWAASMVLGIQKPPSDDAHRLAAHRARLAALDAVEVAWQAFDRQVIHRRRLREICDQLLDAVDAAKDVTQFRAAEEKARDTRRALERETEVRDDG